MINIEALVTYLIFVLILVISIFTLAGVLSIFIIDKKTHLKTLHSMGLPLKKIENIFISQGDAYYSYRLFFGGECGIYYMFDSATVWACHSKW